MLLTVLFPLLLVLHVQQFGLHSSTHWDDYSTRVVNIDPLLDFYQP